MPDKTVPMHEPELPDAAALTAWQAEIAAARQNPWLASLFMRRLGTLHTRFAMLRDWLSSLPRRLRRGWARGWTRRWALTLPAAALVMALASWSALAKMDAAITVGTGGCTLAAAITNANNDNQSGSASCAGGSGADTIGFANANGIYSYTSALPTITSAITIQGNGNTTIRRTGGPEFSVLRVTNGNGENPGSLALANATITGGSAGSGGGIWAFGSTLNLTSATISSNSAHDGGGIGAGHSTLSLTNVTISGNSAGEEGGGIYAFESTVSLTNARVNGNSTSHHAGGIRTSRSMVSLTSTSISGNSVRYIGGGIIATDSTMSLTNVTISGNSAGAGSGGILVRYGTLSLQDATVSGNSAGEDGGGIRTYEASVSLSSTTISSNWAGGNGGGIRTGFKSAVSLTNVTISGNSAGGNGGGIFATEGTTRLAHATISGNSTGGAGGGIHVNTEGVVPGRVEIQSSIVAEQTAGADCAGMGELVSGGYNIESATSCGFTGTGDQQSVSAAALKLGALGLNAPGTTRTRALGAGSAAVNQIPSATNGCGTAITTDQRGVARPQEAGCDVGAFELLPGEVVRAGRAFLPVAWGR